MISAIERKTLNEINQIFDRNITRVECLIEQNFRNESIIILVTIFEVYFRDLFQNTREIWFNKPSRVLILSLDIQRKFIIRKKIKEFLQEVQAYDDFVNNYYIYEGNLALSSEGDILPDPDIECVNDTIFSKKRLNFQNLKERNGARNIYSMIYGFDFMDHLDETRSVSHERWKKLIEIFEERHNIIHNGIETEYSIEEIEAVIHSVKYLKKSTMEMISAGYERYTFQ
jgi:hypothetical protein